MAKLLFRLRNVPEDEAEEVRSLLSEHDIEIYETGGGNWGISMPAIWIRHDEQHETARALLDEYQEQRAIAAREAFHEQQRRGEHPSQLDMVKQQPLKTLGCVAVAAAIVYFSVALFFRF